MSIADPFSPDELYPGLDIVSDCCFDKLFGDALTNKELLGLVRAKAYENLCLCGLDECGCVAATALGAVKRGIKTDTFLDVKLIPTYGRTKVQGNFDYWGIFLALLQLTNGFKLRYEAICWLMSRH